MISQTPRASPYLEKYFQVFDMEFVNDVRSKQNVPISAAIMASGDIEPTLFVCEFGKIKLPKGYRIKAHQKYKEAGDDHGAFVTSSDWLTSQEYKRFLARKEKVFQVIPQQDFVGLMRDLVRQAPTYSSGSSQDNILLGLPQGTIKDLQKQTDFIFTKADLMGVPHFPDEEIQAFMQVLKNPTPNPTTLNFIMFASGNGDVEELVEYSHLARQAGMMTKEYSNKVLSKLENSFQDWSQH